MDLSLLLSSKLSIGLCLAILVVLLLIALVLLSWPSRKPQATTSKPRKTSKSSPQKKPLTEADYRKYLGLPNHLPPVAVHLPDGTTIGSQPLFLDVRDFGAKCDGMTDDTAAVQAALDTASATVRGYSIDTIILDEYPKEPSVSDNLRALLMRNLTSSKSSGHVHTGVYTGALETYTIAPDVFKLVLNQKGKPIALLAGDQVLPFEPITVSDTLAKGYSEEYAKGHQGRILQLKGERPKGR